MTPEGWARTFVGSLVVLLTIGGIVVGLPWWGALLIAVGAVVVNSLILQVEDGNAK